MTLVNEYLILDVIPLGGKPRKMLVSLDNIDYFIERGEVLDVYMKTAPNGAVSVTNTIKQITDWLQRKT